MPMESPEEVVAMTSSHLEYLTEMNDELQQFKGRTQTAHSMLSFLQDNAGEIEAELNLDAIAEARTAAETLGDQIDYWIEETASLRETVQNVNTGAESALLFTNSLAEIEEDLPEHMEAVETSFKKYQETTEPVHGKIKAGTEVLEQLVILLIDTPESEEIGEITDMLTEHLREIKEHLGIE